MPITFIIPNLNFSGGIKVIKEYCTKLNEYGHDCQLWYPVTEWTKHFWQKEYDYPYAHTYLLPWQIPDADVVIATAWETAYIVNDLPLSKGRKFYFCQHNEQIFDPENKRIGGTYNLNLEHIYVSDFIKQHIQNSDSMDAIMLFGQLLSNVVHNGILVPETINKDYRTPSILFPIRSLKWKGWHTLKPALERIHEEFPNVPIRCYGIDKPDDVNSWIEVYENCGQETVDWLMETSNIFVFPSEIEGFGLPALEAAAYGCAVVTTRDNAMHEILGSDARYVYNSEDMYKTIKFFIETELARISYGKHARENAEEYTIDRAAREFERVICTQP
jgi:L-malate glycosyltransferase